MPVRCCGAHERQKWADGRSGRENTVDGDPADQDGVARVLAVAAEVLRVHAPDVDGWCVGCLALWAGWLCSRARRPSGRDALARPTPTRRTDRVGSSRSLLRSVRTPGTSAVVVAARARHDTQREGDTMRRASGHVEIGDGFSPQRAAAPGRHCVPHLPDSRWPHTSARSSKRAEPGQYLDTHGCRGTPAPNGDRDISDDQWWPHPSSQPRYAHQP